jgi:hypothetical protein
MRLAEYIGECGWFHEGKAAVAIVQKYRDGLPEPSRGKDQVNGMISVDVARFDL